MKWKVLGGGGWAGHIWADRHSFWHHFLTAGTPLFLYCLVTLLGTFKKNLEHSEFQGGDGGWVCCSVIVHRHGINMCNHGKSVQSFAMWKRHCQCVCVCGTEYQAKKKLKGKKSSIHPNPWITVPFFIWTWLFFLHIAPLPYWEMTASVTLTTPWHQWFSFSVEVWDNDALYNSSLMYLGTRVVGRGEASKLGQSRVTRRNWDLAGAGITTAVAILLAETLSTGLRKEMVAELEVWLGSLWLRHLH